MPDHNMTNESSISVMVTPSKISPTRCTRISAAEPVEFTSDIISPAPPMRAKVAAPPRHRHAKYNAALTAAIKISA